MESLGKESERMDWGFLGVVIFFAVAIVGLFVSILNVRSGARLAGIILRLFRVRHRWSLTEEDVVRELDGLELTLKEEQERICLNGSEVILRRGNLAENHSVLLRLRFPKQIDPQKIVITIKSSKPGYPGFAIDRSYPASDLVDTAFVYHQEEFPLQLRAEVI